MMPDDLTYYSVFEKFLLWTEFTTAGMIFGIFEGFIAGVLLCTLIAKFIKYEDLDN